VAKKKARKKPCRPKKKRAKAKPRPAKIPDPPLSPRVAHLHDGQPYEDWLAGDPGYPDGDFSEVLLNLASHQAMMEHEDFRYAVVWNNRSRDFDALLALVRNDLTCARTVWRWSQTGMLPTPHKRRRSGQAPKLAAKVYDPGDEPHAKIARRVQKAADRAFENPRAARAALRAFLTHVVGEALTERIPNGGLFRGTHAPYTLAPAVREAVVTALQEAETLRSEREGPRAIKYLHNPARPPRGLALDELTETVCVRILVQHSDLSENHLRCWYAFAGEVNPSLGSEEDWEEYVKLAVSELETDVSGPDELLIDTSDPERPVYRLVPRAPNALPPAWSVLARLGQIHKATGRTNNRRKATENWRNVLKRRGITGTKRDGHTVYPAEEVIAILLKETYLTPEEAAKARAHFTPPTP